MQTTLVTRLEEVSTRITNLEARLSPLEDLPILSTRLSTAVEAITHMQSEQANLRRQLDKISSANSVAARDVSAGLRIEYTEYLKGWSVVESAPLEECVSVLQMHIKGAEESFVPLKTASPGKKRHPWFTTEHQSMIQERDCLYRRFRKTRLPLDLLTYRQARDVAHRTIEEARLNYHHARLSSLTDAKDIWRALEHLGISGSKKKSFAPLFTTTELNAHFRGVSFDQDTPPVADFLDSLASSTHNEQFSFDEFEISDVVAAVAHFKTQAGGLDGIPQHVIQLAFPFLAPIICRIFNRSMRETFFPRDWKKSIAIALSKVSSSSCLSDFRPISLLSFFSKTLEWLAQRQLSAYLESRLYLDPLQTGFRSGHSTQTCLLKLTDDIRLAIERRHVTLLLLFDFSKAFDSVCHVRLLKKLLDYGLFILAIRWIASYLTDREQAVDGAGNFSIYLNLNTGVPQGSVLGPLLFSIYVNNISLCLDHDISHLMYADDLRVYIRCPLGELDRVFSTMSANALRIMC